MDGLLIPTDLEFSQKTAFPGTGLKTAPPTTPSPPSTPGALSFGHSTNSHHLGSLLAGLMYGNGVPPPSKPSSAATHTMKLLTRPQPPASELQSKCRP